MSCTCRHFNGRLDGACDQGVNYQQLAGGGVFTLVYRLPCMDISNRRGEVAAKCEKHEAAIETEDGIESPGERVLP